MLSAVVSGGSLLIFLLGNHQTIDLKTSTTLIFAGMVVMSIVAGWAAKTSRILVLTAVFIVSFLPLGLYLALLPGWLRISGLAQLGYPVAVILMLYQRRQQITEA